jgi:hypothetical protein
MGQRGMNWAAPYQLVGITYLLGHQTTTPTATPTSTTTATGSPTPPVTATGSPPVTATASPTSTMTPTAIATVISVEQDIYLPLIRR